jgi:hypothetical protein
MHLSEVRQTSKPLYIVFLPEKRQQGLTSWLESASELQDPAQLRLAVAGVIVEEMRAAVFQQTGFHCSAGISHNKVCSDYTEFGNIFYTANLKITVSIIKYLTVIFICDLLFVICTSGSYLMPACIVTGLCYAICKFLVHCP